MVLRENKKSLAPARARIQARARATREYVLKQVWASHVKEEFDLINAIQTKAAFSYATAVMDRIGGWEEGDEQDNWVGARFAASIWIFTTYVVCNGHRNMQAFRVNKMKSIVEAVKLVCDDIFEDHERVSEVSLSLQEAQVSEALHCDIEVPCVVQWGCGGSLRRQISNMTC